MKEHESDIGAFLAGFVFGALVGAATALILAPQSGQATRNQIAGIGADLREAGSDRISHVRDTTDTLTRDYREKAETLMHDTKERMHHLGDQVQDQVRIVLDSGKKKGDEIAEDIANAIDENTTTE